QGFTVVCPDLAGHGRSSCSGEAARLGPGGPSGETNMVACLTGLTRHYAGNGASRYFLGSSWGGAMLSLFLAVTGTPAAAVILNDVVIEWQPGLQEVLA